MRIAHKLMLLCAMAIAAIALTPASASAAEATIEVDKEDGTACEPDPCKIQARGESHITRTLDGVEISKCQDTFEAEFRHREQTPPWLEIHSGVGARAIGHVTTWTRAVHPVIGPGCNVTACASAHEREWEIWNAGETGTNRGHFTVEFCLVPTGGTDTHCELEVQVEEPTLHRYQLHTNNLCVFGARRVEGRWSQTTPTVTHPGLEIDHQPN